MYVCMYVCVCIGETNFNLTAINVCMYHVRINNRKYTRTASTCCDGSSYVQYVLYVCMCVCVILYIFVPSDSAAFETKVRMRSIA